jgi:micrococcal nuclease
MSIQRVVVGLALCLSLACTAAARETWQGKVVGVADGDTLKVLRGTTPVKIRLHGVDAPEKAQPFGQKAKQLTSRLVFGQVVIVKPVATDKYGRQVARVYFNPMHVDGLPERLPTKEACLNVELVRAGLAWWYRQYASKDKQLAALEQQARAAKRGLWADKEPMAPWLYRRTRRKAPRAPRPAIGVPPERPWSKDRLCKTDADCVFAPRSGCGCPPCGDRWRRAVNRKHAEWLRQEHAREACPKVKCARCPRPGRWLGRRVKCVKGQCTVTAYRGNVRSKVLHAPGCRVYRCKHCTRAFETVEQATAAGYRPHAACVPGARKRPVRPKR